MTRMRTRGEPCCVAGAGRCGGERMCGELARGSEPSSSVRGPQSAQSEPSAHTADHAPAPPSSQMPSPLWEHVLLQRSADCGSGTSAVASCRSAHSMGCSDTSSNIASATSVQLVGREGWEESAPARIKASMPQHTRNSIWGLTSCFRAEHGTVRHRIAMQLMSTQIFMIDYVTPLCLQAATQPRYYCGIRTSLRVFQGCERAKRIEPWRSAGTSTASERNRYPNPRYGTRRRCNPRRDARARLWQGRRLHCRAVSCTVTRVCDSKE